MEFIIDQTNYKSFIQQNKYLVIDEDFKNNSLLQSTKITVKGIHDKDISCGVHKVDLAQISIEIIDCTFSGFFVIDSYINDIIITRCEISEYIDGKFKPFKSNIDNSKLGRFWIYDSKIYNGFLVRKESAIADISISGSTVEHTFTYVNSTSDKITFESSIIDDLSIDRSQYPEKDSITNINTINVFRTTINKNLKISDVLFKNIHFHKIKLDKSEALTDHFNQIYISIPDKDEQNIVEEIKISESNISAKVVISVSGIKRFTAYETAFFDYRINFWRIDSFIFSECTFSGSVYWGFPNHLKTIAELFFENCIFQGDFYLADIEFEKKCFINSTVFQKYPSFFVNNDVHDGCQTNFKFSSLKNFVFQRIDFKYFTFENLDITNSEFIDCTWDAVEERFLSRNYIIDEKKIKKQNRVLT